MQQQHPPPTTTTTTTPNNNNNPQQQQQLPPPPQQGVPTPSRPLSPACNHPGAPPCSPSVPGSHCMCATTPRHCKTHKHHTPNHPLVRGHIAAPRQAPAYPCLRAHTLRSDALQHVQARCGIAPLGNPPPPCGNPPPPWLMWHRPPVLTPLRPTTHHRHRDGTKPPQPLCSPLRRGDFGGSQKHRRAGPRGL